MFCEFLAPYDKDTRHYENIYAPPSKIRIFDEQGHLHRPFVQGTLWNSTSRPSRCVPGEPPRSLTHPIFCEGRSLLISGALDRETFTCLEWTLPARVFLFGTDRMGRDMFSRCFYGCRISLSIGMLGVFLSLLLGLTLGGISGYRGGWADGSFSGPSK